LDRRRITVTNKLPPASSPASGSAYQAPTQPSPQTHRRRKRSPTSSIHSARVVRPPPHPPGSSTTLERATYSTHPVGWPGVLLCCVVLRCVALRCVVLRCVALCVALCVVWRKGKLNQVAAPSELRHPAPLATPHHTKPHQEQPCSPPLPPPASPPPTHLWGSLWRMSSSQSPDPPTA